MRASGKQLGRLLLQPLDARTDGDEAFGGVALRALRRRRHREAAMMADQPPLEAMIDQPGVAIRALQAEAAGAAQRQRRIAAAIEEQQRLLVALERDLHRLGQPRRDEAPARRPLARADRSPRSIGRCWPPNRSGRCNALVAAAPRVDFRLDRRRRRGQHHRDFRHAARAPPPCRGRDNARRPPACRPGRAPHRRRSGRDRHKAETAPSARRPPPTPRPPPRRPRCARACAARAANAIPPAARRSARRSDRGTAR